MELTYHIHFRPAGQHGSALGSIVPTNEAGGYASGPFVRALWDDMKNGLYRLGFMSHPDTGQRLEFASLHYAGRAGVSGSANGGMLCEKWDTENGLIFLYEPEPALYGAEAKTERMRVANIPEQPEPPRYEIEEPDNIVSDYGVLHELERDAADREPYEMPLEILTPKSRKKKIAMSG